MKEFLKNQKITYNLMSFTGYKALILFSLLSESPKSYKEISNYFINHPYLREKISIDTLRVYINSLKRIGCEVKRFRDENKESRYFITSHPFELKLSQAQIESIKKVYKSIAKDISVEELLALDNFFEKLGKQIKNQDFVDDIKQVSLLKGIDKDLLKNLMDCCEKKQQIIIEYTSPNNGKKDIEIVTDKIDLSNNKIYLHGYGLEYSEYGIFLINRINQIKEIKINSNTPKDIKKVTVTYEIRTDINKINLEDFEKVLHSSNDKTIIEATVSNTFLLKQRLLEFGPTCKIISPTEFRNEFLSLLKDMKAGYYFD